MGRGGDHFNCRKRKQKSNQGKAEMGEYTIEDGKTINSKAGKEVVLRRKACG